MHHEVFEINRNTDPALIKLLKRHTFQSESLMNDRLFELYAEKHEMWPSAAHSGHAILLYDDYGKFVGWSLVFKMDIGFRPKPILYAYFWIKVRSRRRGYGKTLLGITKKHFGVSKFNVEPHDFRSYQFFDKHN